MHRTKLYYSLPKTTKVHHLYERPKITKIKEAFLTINLNTISCLKTVINLKHFVVINSSNICFRQGEKLPKNRLWKNIFLIFAPVFKEKA